MPIIITPESIKTNIVAMTNRLIANICLTKKIDKVDAVKEVIHFLNDILDNYINSIDKTRTKVDEILDIQDIQKLLIQYKYIKDEYKQEINILFKKILESLNDKGNESNQ